MKPDGLFIEFLVGGHWRNDQTAGAFDSEHHAIDYLLANLSRYPNTYLRISTRLFEVRADGVYQMSNRHGWQKYEGVQS